MFMLWIGSKAVGQTPTTTSVTINSSYVANSYIYVHPYFSQPPNTSGTAAAAQAGSGESTPLIFDANISFRFNKGTKFFVNKVVNSGGTITGYVISPWYYTNTTAKATFYSKLNPAAAPAPPAKKPQNQKQQQLQQQQKEATDAQKAATKQSVIVKNTQSDVDAKTKKVAGDQADIQTAQTAADNAKNAFYHASLYYNSNSAEFKNAQASARTSEIDGTNAGQQNLIQQSLKLPDDTSLFTKLKNTFKNADGALKDASNKLSKDLDSLAKSTNDLMLQKANLKSINANMPIQHQKDPKSKDFYDITKLQVGDIADNLVDDSSPAAGYDALAYVESWANGWQFYMSAKDFSDNATMIYPASTHFTWGFLTLPVKMRFDNPSYFTKGGEFNFEQNLNFGLTFGLKHQWVNRNDISTNYLFGLSVDNVPINGDKTGDGTPQAGQSTSTAAISTSLGTMFQYNKFQIGIFGGLDFAGAHANDFPFQGRFWLGFAIGVSLFGESQTSASTQQQ